MQLITEFTFPPSALRCRSRNQICVEAGKNCNCRPTPQERQRVMSANQPNSNQPTRQEVMNSILHIRHLIFVAKL
jgi:hypothetical protein